MKVILLKDIKNLGKTGEVKDVKEGYAHHFLIPGGLAALPGNNQGKELRSEIAKKNLNQKAKSDEVKEIAAGLHGKTFIFNVKTDVKGHPYAAISPKEIAEKLGVDARFVRDHFKQIGVFPLIINFTPTVQAEVKIEIRKTT